MNLFKEGNTPPTTGTRTTALGNQAGDPGLFMSDEAQNFPFTYMEAIANFSIEFHLKAPFKLFLLCNLT
jgi:hypothetical protein